MNAHLALFFLLLWFLLLGADPIRVEIVRCQEQYLLLREGRPYSK